MRQLLDLRSQTLREIVSYQTKHIYQLVFFLSLFVNIYTCTSFNERCLFLLHKNNLQWSAQVYFPHIKLARIDVHLLETLPDASYFSSASVPFFWCWHLRLSPICPFPLNFFSQIWFFTFFPPFSTFFSAFPFPYLAVTYLIHYCHQLPNTGPSVTILHFIFLFVHVFAWDSRNLMEIFF